MDAQEAREKVERELYNELGFCFKLQNSEILLIIFSDKNDKTKVESLAPAVHLVMDKVFSKLVELKMAAAHSAQVEAERDGLRQRVHFLEGHNQIFERCESGWCHPHHSEFDLATYPALTFKCHGKNYRDELQAELVKLRARESQIMATLNMLPSVDHPPITDANDIVYAIRNLQECYKSAAESRNGLREAKLREALRQAFELLAALNIAVEWELAPPIKRRIAEIVKLSGEALGETGPEEK
jgi:hypothetical protein